MSRHRSHEIQAILNSLYPCPPIPLNHHDIFSFLVSVVLSAQTTDGKVNEVTKHLFKIAPDPLALSRMNVTDVQEIISPVGLSARKAEYIVNLSKKILEDFQGKVPATFEELESLPGVGHKTASVVMSQAFGVPALAVDTHVHRLANRWGLSKESNVDKVQTDLCSIFPMSDWNTVHLQMIYFGREYCSAKDHQPSECPMCSWVNNSSKSPPTSFEQFRKQNKSKGIIYYDDRIAELNENPSLTSLLLPSSGPSPIVSSSIEKEPETLSLAASGRKNSRKRNRSSE